MMAKRKLSDTSNDPASYDRDLVAWSIEQARLLRAGLFDQLDIEHIVDEIEDVGKSEARELGSRLILVLAHWLKWQYQPTHRSISWRNTVREQRKQVWRRLTRTPSLRAELANPDFVADVWSDALILAARETGMDVANFPVTCPWSLLDVLGEDWLPEGENAGDVEASRDASG